jgi:hypothetical protein
MKVWQCVAMGLVVRLEGLEFVREAAATAMFFKERLIRLG